jgi:hypothetical protein
MRHLGRAMFGTIVAMALAAPAADAQFNSGSNGTFGPINVTGTQTLTTPPDGVFHATTVSVSGTLRFTRNAANTPITILATGNVMISGTIDVSAPFPTALCGSTTALGSNAGPGGPGGFDGGAGATGLVSTVGGAGLGPGGGAADGGTSGGGGGAGFVVPGNNGGGGTPGTGGPAYGTSSLVPLIGGSGGGGGGAVLGATGCGGGGGGGAIVIASSGTISFSGFGNIRATGAAGGNVNLFNLGMGGGGSGGSIRLVASTITGSGTIQITGGGGTTLGNSVGGAGSVGRFRAEAFTNTSAFNMTGAPAAAVSVGQPSSVTLAGAPTLRITSIGGVAAPTSPTASLTRPDVVLPTTTTNPVTVSLAGTNIPLGTVITVTVGGQNGGAASTASSGLAGTLAASTASASVTIPTNQPSIVSASASFVIANAEGGPLFVDGEPVERVRVSATLGGVSRVSYVTRSGREIGVATSR